MTGTHYRAHTSQLRLTSVNEGSALCRFKLEWYHDEVRFYIEYRNGLFFLFTVQSLKLI